MTATDEFDVIVLAGGRAARMGGVDKVVEPVGDRPLIVRALEAAAGATRIVVAGPRRPAVLGPELAGRVIWVQESPRFSGPVHAVNAALASTGARLIVLMAADMPLVTRESVASLVGRVGDRDGAIATSGGRDQPLLGAYRREALARGLSRLRATEGASMGALTSHLDLVRVRDDASAIDCDTPEDLRMARVKLEGAPNG